MFFAPVCLTLVPFCSCTFCPHTILCLFALCSSQIGADKEINISDTEKQSLINSINSVLALTPDLMPTQLGQSASGTSLANQRTPSAPCVTDLTKDPALHNTITSSCHPSSSSPVLTQSTTAKNDTVINMSTEGEMKRPSSATALLPDKTDSAASMPNSGTSTPKCPPSPSLSASVSSPAAVLPPALLDMKSKVKDVRKILFRLIDQNDFPKLMQYPPFVRYAGAKNDELMNTVALVSQGLAV